MPVILPADSLIYKRRTIKFVSCIQHDEDQNAMYALVRKQRVEQSVPM